MTEFEKVNLLEKAKQASMNSYSPYSNFSVGSAVLLKDSTVYSGCNIENSSYGLTICAERTAIAKAISEGRKDIVAVAVYSPSGDISPCGACRQFISEFGSDIKIIYMFNNKIITKTISELMPDTFTKDNIL